MLPFVCPYPKKINVEKSTTPSKGVVKKHAILITSGILVMFYPRGLIPTT